MLTTIPKPSKVPLPVLLLLLILFSGSVRGQSIDIGAPSPVRTSEVVGSIVARDLGDARLTDHFYAFVGNPGDLLLTIESRNLNGDIDVFTAVGLKPLLKFSVYAESSAPIAKGVFLRRRVELILRVEARTPNDDEGMYQIRFGGSFEPLATPVLAEGERSAEESVTSTSRPGDKKARRVSSVGARIKEPEPPPAEVAVVPTPEPTLAATPEQPIATGENPTEAEAPKTTTTRNARSRRPSSRRTNSRPPAETRRSGNEDARAGDDQPAEKTAESAEASSPSSSTPSKPAKRGTARAAEPAAQPEQERDAGPRLVIETRDGTLIDRFMSTVRRVMVENGLVVVVGKDGRVERVRLSEVVRMSIAP